MSQVDISALRLKVANKSPEEVISWFLKEYKGKIALSNSLGAEDQAITHMICQIDPSTPIFTLDTGRIFPETYDLIDRTNQRYVMRFCIISRISKILLRQKVLWMLLDKLKVKS